MMKKGAIIKCLKLRGKIIKLMRNDMDNLLHVLLPIFSIVQVQQYSNN